QVSDPLEREADRAADQVVSAIQQGSSRSPSLSQQMPSTNEVVQRKCKACESEDEQSVDVQRKPAPDAGGSSAALAPPGFATQLSRARAHGGHAMAPALTSAMESGFSADFSRVKLHHDGGAARLADQIG